MIKVKIKIDSDQTVEIGECHVEVDLSMNRIIGEGCNMITIIKVTLGEEILEEHNIIEVKISEVDIEVTIEMKTLEEVEVGLEKDCIQVILEETIKAVADQDWV